MVGSGLCGRVVMRSRCHRNPRCQAERERTHPADQRSIAPHRPRQRDLTPGVNPTTPEATLAYDKAGNQTDDGQHFTYTYDAWGRLVEVKKKTGGTLVAKYRYNGLGFRIGWLHDADQSGTTTETGTGHDNWLWFIYNDRWQQLASFRVLATAVNGWAYDFGSDTTPKELFVNHAAGLDGLGGSSDIDEVVLRDADETTDTPSPGTPNWAGASDNAFDSRLFYLQNWRADVVVTVKEAVEDSPPAVVDHVRYSSYGVPWGTSMADVVAVGGNGLSPYSPDGQITVDDVNTFTAWFSDDNLNADVTGVGGFADQLTPPDGQLTVDDVQAFVNALADDADNTGRGVLSRTHSRRGYAGYEYDPGLWYASSLISGTVPPRSMWHVRNRVLDSETGRWTRRDPLGYVDGMGLYEYVAGMPLLSNDPSGLAATAARTCATLAAISLLDLEGRNPCERIKRLFQRGVALPCVIAFALAEFSEDDAARIVRCCMRPQSCSSPQGGTTGGGGGRPRPGDSIGGPSRSRPRRDSPNCSCVCSRDGGMFEPIGILPRSDCANYPYDNRRSGYVFCFCRN